jgi:hypothetical protein
MKCFYVTIEVHNANQYKINYWYVTDLRDFEIVDEIPVNKINKWIEIIGK